MLIPTILPPPNWKIKYEGTNKVVLKIGIIDEYWNMIPKRTFDLEIGMDLDIYVNIYLGIYDVIIDNRHINLEEEVFIKIYDKEGHLIKICKPKYL